MTYLNDLPEQLLALAQRSGAAAVEVLQSQSFSRPVVFEANRLKQLEVSTAIGTALRLWRNGRPGLAVAYGPVSPQQLVEKALAISDLNEAEFPELTSGGRQEFPALGSPVSAETLVEGGKTAIERIRQVYPESVCEGTLECETEVTRLVNSSGLDYCYEDTTLSCYFEAEWIRGDDFLAVGDGAVARDRLDIPAVVDEILQRIHWAKETVESPQGRLPVVFTAKAADMLWETVQAALNGKRVLEQSSPWSDLQGQEVASTMLTIEQDPGVGPYSCPFDDEGVLTQSLSLIEAGQLAGIYCDRKIGRALGRSSTGNGFRPGLGSYPLPSLLNLLVKPGQRSLLAIMADLEDAVVVDQVLGGGAGISGELSVNLELGYRLHQGEIVGRLKDTMVAGNVYSVLKQIVELANDGVWNGSCYTPSLVVEGLSITGKR